MGGCRLGLFARSRSVRLPEDSPEQKQRIQRVPPGAEALRACGMAVSIPGPKKAIDPGGLLFYLLSPAAEERRHGPGRKLGANEVWRCESAANEAMVLPPAHSFGAAEAFCQDQQAAFRSRRLRAGVNNEDHVQIDGFATPH